MAHEPLIAQEILNVYLPDLNNVSFEAILEARHKLKDVLAKFRIEVAALASSMKSTTLSNDTLREAYNIVRSTVVPAVEDLKSKLKSSRDKTIIRAFKNVTSPKSYLPFLGTILSDLSNVAAGFASIGFAAVGTAIESIAEKKEIMRGNRFTFLLSAPKTIMRHPHRVRPKKTKFRVPLKNKRGAIVICQRGDDPVVVKVVDTPEFMTLLDQNRNKAEKYLAKMFNEREERDRS
jgi:hypothetical protein